MLAVSSRNVAGLPGVVSQVALGPVESPHEEFVFDEIVNALSIQDEPHFYTVTF